MEGFNYIVKKQEQQKICFGSGQPRNIGLKSSMNSFMRHYASEDNPNIGPGHYNVIESFKNITAKPAEQSFSKKGYSGLGRYAMTMSHVDDYPGPCEYNLPTFPSKVKELRNPFNSTAKRRTIGINQNPGPGLYRNITPIRRRIIFDHSFGGSVKMRLAVQIKCCKRNTDLCIICNENPIGDYWHLNNRLFLCRSCMTSERQRPRKFNKKELRDFQKIRDCSMIHSHDGTDAKLWLMHPSQMEKWSQREAYLSLYFKD